MNPLTVIAIVLGVILAILIVLSLVGKKLQKKSDAAQENIAAGAQYYSIMVIDKKRMKLSEAGFPQIVIDQTPKWLRGRKVPVVKAKIGPKIASLMCDEKVFDKVPVKKEVKAFMNGIYIIDVKGLRSGLDTKPEKKKFLARLRDKAQKVVDESKKPAKATPGGIEQKKGKKK
ncbi:MAG: hypothetical protein IJZ55_06360 [Lachnospiraceae bacterium]|nr:hypothetical protein [Lachnospiraceae bacterium]